MKQVNEQLNLKEEFKSKLQKAITKLYQKIEDLINIEAFYVTKMQNADKLQTSTQEDIDFINS